MATINKANREVCDVDIRILKTKKPFLFFDTANTTTTGFTSEETFAMAKGAKRIAFSNPMDGTVTLEAQVAPFKLYSMLSDGTIDTEAVIARKKSITCKAAGVLELPEGIVAGTVFVYADDDFAGEEIKGTVDMTAKTFTAAAADEISVDSVYEAGYLLSKKTGVQKISFNNQKNPLDYYVTMNTVEKDESGMITPYIMTFYKLKPKKALDLSFSSSGDPATIKVEFSALEDKDGNCMDMVELEDSED